MFEICEFGHLTFKCRNFSLGFYDIVDITPGSNSDFVRSLPIDIVHEIRQLKSLPTIKMDSTDNMKKYIVDFIRVLLIIT
jgi:hypothetical protein